MELRQLRYFVAIVQAGGYRKAARELSVTTSTLSRQITALEVEVGTALFVRGGGRAEAALTEAGELLLPRALSAIEAADEAQAELTAFTGMARGQITLIPGATVRSSWHKWLSEFHRAHPGVQIRLREGRSVDGALEMIGAGEVDLALMTTPSPPSLPGIVTETLAESRLVAVVPPGHRLADRGTIRLSSLRGESWILLHRDDTVRRLVTEAAARMGFTPHVDFEASGFNMMRMLMLEGLGVTAVPRYSAAMMSPGVLLELGPEPLTCTAVLAYRDRGPGSPARRSFIDFIRRRFSEQDGIAG